MLFLLTPLMVFAQNRVVEIPLWGDDANPLKNIITVAKANGNFTDPVAAVNSIKNASDKNPYLVVIGPGVYTITKTLVMQEYVDIVGSGENLTKIKGAISTGAFASSAIISGADNSTLSSLTVENTGGSSYSIGVFNNNASPTLSNVTVTTYGASYNYSIYNNVSSPTMTGVTATGSGGNQSIGVYNYSSSPTMTNVTATASGGAAESIGVHNFTSSAMIRRSTIKGDTCSLYTQTTAVTISQSTLLGSVYGASLNKCVACDDGNGTALGANCQ